LHYKPTQSPFYLLLAQQEATEIVKHNYTGKQFADSFTKPLSYSYVSFLREMVGILPVTDDYNFFWVYDTQI
jgi:hypothetical protein